jgi:hypothetical protein
VLEPTNKRVDHTCKKKRAGRRIFFAQGEVRALGRGRRATIGHRPAAALSGCQTNSLQIF